jgi:hypothetical protein
LTADPRKEKKSSGQNARRPGRDHLVTGGGIIQESLGAIIPLQTGGFVGIGTLALLARYARIANEAVRVKLTATAEGLVVEIGFVGLPRPWAGKELSS